MVEEINSWTRKDYNLHETNLVVEVIEMNLWIIYEIPGYGVFRQQLRIWSVIMD
jgi:hypothetical protein